MVYSDDDEMDGVLFFFMARAQRCCMTGNAGKFSLKSVGVLRR